MRAQRAVRKGALSASAIVRWRRTDLGLRLEENHTDRERDHRYRHTGHRSPAVAPPGCRKVPPTRVIVAKPGEIPFALCQAKGTEPTECLIPAIPPPCPRHGGEGEEGEDCPHPITHSKRPPWPPNA